MDEISSSRAMISPGIAGSATTMITGTLVSIFGFPGAITALAVSFLFGLMILADKTEVLYLKIVLYLINSMTIFSVAVGLNQAGIAIVERDKPVVTLERKLEPADAKNKPEQGALERKFFQEWF